MSRASSPSTFRRGRTTGTAPGLGNMELYVAARRYFGWYVWRAFNLVVNAVELTSTR